MTARDAHLDQIVQGCRLILAGLQQQRQGFQLRDDGFTLVVREDGLNAREAAEAIQDRLRAEGFTDGQIAKLGVSAWNIRPIVKHRQS